MDTEGGRAIEKSAYKTASAIITRPKAIPKLDIPVKPRMRRTDNSNLSDDT